MLSLSAQSYQFGFGPKAVPAVDGVRSVDQTASANRSAMLDVSTNVGERNFQRGGVNGQLDGVQVGKLTNFQGGHRQELAVDSFSTVDSFGLKQSFDLGNGSGGFGGYSQGNKKLNQAAIIAKSDIEVSSELLVLSGHIVLVMWQSVELFLAPIWKFLFTCIQKLFGINLALDEQLTGSEQADQGKNVFEIDFNNKEGGLQPFNIFKAG